MTKLRVWIAGLTVVGVLGSMLISGAVAASGASSPQNNRHPNAKQAQIVPDFPVVAGSQFVSLSTMAFAPMAFAPDSIRFFDSLDYFNRWGIPFERFGPKLANDEFFRCFNAGPVLPDGATLIAIRFFYASGNHTDLYATFIRQDLIANTTDRFVEVFPADDSGTKTSVTALVPAAAATVDNRKYGYGVGVCPVADTSFNGVTIQYVP